MKIVSLIDYFYYILPYQNMMSRALRYGIRVLYNVMMTILLKVPICGKNEGNGSYDVIISLTSFPDRTINLWKVIKCILLQDYKKTKVILWLSQEQYAAKSDLPKSLLALCRQGLEIRLVEGDIKSHKKYYYAFKEFPNNIIITLDDDILYHHHIVSALIEQHKKHPNCVICNRGVRIAKDKPYNQWEQISDFGIPKIDILPTGVGGILYPPHCYKSDIFNLEAIKETCLKGDDLWLNFMCRLEGTQIVHTGFKTGFISILSSQKKALCHENIEKHANDMQIESIDAWAKRFLNSTFYVNI